MNCRQCGHEMHEYTQEGRTLTNSRGETMTTRTTVCVTCKNENCNDHGPYLLYYQTLDKANYPTMSFDKYLKPELRENNEAVS